MKVEKIDDIEKLEMMRVDWDALLAVNTTYSPFMTFDWIYNWWQYLGEKNKMFLLVAKSEGNIVGIAPLMISKLKYGVRQLGFMVDENVSRFDFLVFLTYLL